MKKKIKIVYIINSLKIGGPVNMLHNLVKYIDKDKFEISIITIKECDENIKKDFSEIDCTIIELKKEGFIKTVKTIKEEVKKINPDIVHSHGGKADLINSRIKGTHKSFATVHCVPDEDFIMKKGEIIGRLKANAFIHTMGKIDVPIACSNTVAKKILKQRNIKIDYIRNGINLKNIDISKTEVSREELGIDSDKIVLVFCGYLSKRKNVKLLIEAFECINRDDLVLLVLGDGSELKYLKEIAKNIKNVVMIGRIKNSYTYLNCGDYFISGSLSEGLPLAVMEGMACGLPAILSDIESHKELRDLSPKAVELFENNDKESLIGLLERLNQTEYRKKSDEAYKLIIDTLNANEMTKLYEKKYFSINEAGND